MSQRSPGSLEPGNDEWPDDLWPDEDDQQDPAGSSVPPGRSGWPVAAGPSGWPGSGPPRRPFRPVILVVIALGAALAGAGIALGARGLSGPSGTAATPGSQPSYLAPGQSGNVRPGLPGTGPGGTAGIFLIGRVTAVSRTSITIGGPGRSITAAVTASTRVTGTVSSISGIKVGDWVSAQISQTGSTYTATAIQYPTRSPVGVTVP